MPVKPETAKKQGAGRKVASAAKVKKPISPFRAWADRPGRMAITELCQHIVEGGHLAGFAKAHGFAYVTLLDWINAEKPTEEAGRPLTRAEMYARAREDRADVLADEIVAIADEECTMVKRSKHGPADEDDTDAEVEVVFDPVAVMRNRLRVDARKWSASKLKPRTYGDKVQAEVTGQGGGPVMVAVSNLDEQL